MTGTNWDQELKRIEREFQGLSPDPVIKLDSARSAADKHAQERRQARGSAIGAWVRVLLVAALAAAIFYWPYAHACGAGLYYYLAATALIGIGALWSAASSWNARVGVAHGLGIFMLIVSLALLAAEVLPRVGYAKVDAARPPAWRCVAR